MIVLTYSWYSPMTWISPIKEYKNRRRLGLRKAGYDHSNSAWAVVWYLSLIHWYQQCCMILSHSWNSLCPFTITLLFFISFCPHTAASRHCYCRTTCVLCLFHQAKVFPSQSYTQFCAKINFSTILVLYLWHRYKNYFGLWFNVL